MCPSSEQCLVFMIELRFLSDIGLKGGKGNFKKYYFKRKIISLNLIMVISLKEVMELWELWKHRVCFNFSRTVSTLLTDDKGFYIIYPCLDLNIFWTRFHQGVHAITVTKDSLMVEFLPLVNILTILKIHIS